ncbi:TPA: hypothetical protein ACSP15_003559 [Aeromonas veronii]
MSKHNVIAIVEMLESRSLLAAWLEFSPNGERLDMVLMMNTQYQDIDAQRHFAHCVFDGEDFTDKAPAWLLTT